MDLIRARTVSLVLEDLGMVRAVIGTEELSISGMGESVPDALRDLASRVESSPEVTVWVPRRAKEYRLAGALFIDCPECGHPHSVPDETYRTIAFICSACGEAVDVEP